ncbi:TolC family protein [Campylobacter sputorum]|uniref:TolC family protein n=1 Tax=Campylobacter sputorum TaxID=206 RepID=UPI00053C01D0|nr:TolC family protein [Campylobacter sputorum]
MKNLIIIFMIIFSGCAIKEYDFTSPIGDVNESYYEQNLSWWEDYDNVLLSKTMQTILENNLDLKNSNLNIDKFIAYLGLSKADLLPTFGASYNASANKNIDENSNSDINFKSSLSVSYEIDLFGKFMDKYKQSALLLNASKLDLNALDLSIKSDSVSTFFNLMYLQNSKDKIYKMKQNYEKLKEIIVAKFNYGRADKLEVEQINQSLLQTDEKILNINTQIYTTREKLKNLMYSQNLPNLENYSILDTKLLGISREIPLEILSNRPDVKAAELRLKAAFYNYKYTFKSLYPNVTIGASLNSNEQKFDDSFKLNFLNGNIQITLPFLDFARVKNNIKISEIEYEMAKNDFLTKLNSAINEFYRAFLDYENYKLKFENTSKILTHSINITKYYQIRYDSGKNELYDLLNSQNTKLNYELNLLYDKYILLQNENLIYKIVGGKI